MDKRSINEKKKAFLWSYRDQKMRAERIKEQQEELRENKISISILNDGMPRGTSKSDLSDYAIQFDELEQKLRVERFKSVQRFLLVRNSIESIENDKEKTILTYRYLRGYTWEKIAEKTKYCQQWVRKLHAQALDHFEIPKEALESAY